MVIASIYILINYQSDWKSVPVISRKPPSAQGPYDAPTVNVNENAEEKIKNAAKNLWWEKLGRIGQRGGDGALIHAAAARWKLYQWNKVRQIFWRAVVWRHLLMYEACPVTISHRNNETNNFFGRHTCRTCVNDFSGERGEGACITAQ